MTFIPLAHLALLLVNAIWITPSIVFLSLASPLHPEKFEGPCTCLTVLGIELDSVLLQARLPKDKFDNTTALLEQWSHKRSCKRKDLESLMGHLQHACKVVPQGRSFLRRMINLLCAFRREDHPIPPQPGVLSRPHLVARTLSLLERLQFSSVPPVGPLAGF